MAVSVSVTERHLVIVHRPGKPDVGIDVGGLSRHDLYDMVDEFAADRDELIDIVTEISRALRSV